jgi:hypothetical protein
MAAISNQPMAAISNQRRPLRVADLSLKRLASGLDSSSWQLWHGSQLLRDFGDNEHAARAVLTVLRDQRPTEWFQIGSPQPIVEYGLVNGQPPLMLGQLTARSNGPPSITRPLAADQPLISGTGLDTIIPIDLKSVRVESIHGVWVLRDDHNLLINFADQTHYAEQALAAIHRHGLNRLGLVGRTQPVFRCLFAAADSEIEMLPEPLRRQHLQQQSQALNPVGLPVPGVGFIGLVYRFDARSLRLRRRSGQWQIVTTGDVVIASFGPAENSALDALRFLQDHGITALARYEPLTILLQQDQPASRLPLHTHVQVFDPATLRSVVSGNRCYVAANGRHLCDCQDLNQGQTIIRILQGLRCNLLAHIGPSTRQGLTFFARHP